METTEDRSNADDDDDEKKNEGKKGKREVEKVTPSLSLFILKMMMMIAP
jgi:hypothetical protein